MQLKNTTQGWGVIARLLHWSIAGIILFLLGIGAFTAYFVTDVLEQFRLIQIHKSWGFVVFFLALVRIVWRLFNKQSPALPETYATGRDACGKTWPSRPLCFDAGHASIGLVDGISFAATGPFWC